MHELITLLNQFKCSLDHIDSVKKMINYKKQIDHNQELIDKINRYHKKPNESIKIDIYKYHEFREYKKYENEVNFLILEINQELKKISQ